MATLIKDSRSRSPYFICAYRGADGRRLKKTTKQTNRAKAMQICVRWEEQAEKARAGSLTAAQARKVLAEMVTISSGETLTNYTVKGWLDEWLTNTEGSTAASTILRYKQVLRDFLENMERRANTSLAGVTPGDIIRYRDALREGGRAVSSVNVTVKKILSIPFEAARREGYILTNPVAAVKPLKDRAESRKAGREPFTPDEVKKLAMAAGEKSDWRGAILLAATTGLRLGDVANLSWQAIDDDSGLMRVETQKTEAVVTLPLHPDFATWLKTTTRGIGKAPVFPSLAGRGTGGRRGLSADFRKVMKDAEITSRSTERKGEGRTTFAKGFHSLRHTYISGLANAGVASDIRQKLAGHTDAKVHAGYSHHELATLRDAVKKLPSYMTP